MPQDSETVLEDIADRLPTHPYFHNNTSYSKLLKDIKAFRNVVSTIEDYPELRDEAMAAAEGIKKNMRLHAQGGRKVPTHVWDVFEKASQGDFSALEIDRFGESSVSPEEGTVDRFGESEPLPEVSVKAGEEAGGIEVNAEEDVPKNMRDATRDAASKAYNASLKEGQWAGEGGYVYEQTPEGVKIVKSPRGGAGRVVSEGKAFDSIVSEAKELGKWKDDSKQREDEIASFGVSYNAGVSADKAKELTEDWAKNKGFDFDALSDKMDERDAKEHIAAKTKRREDRAAKKKKRKDDIGGFLQSALAAISGNSRRVAAQEEDED